VCNRIPYYILILPSAGVRALTAQLREVILQSQNFAAHSIAGIAVIAAKASQDYQNLKDALNAQISSNNSAWVRMAAVLRVKQDDDIVWAVQLEAQKLKMEENKRMAEEAMARVQRTHRMEIEDHMKNAEEDLGKQWLELASTKREMKTNKKQWQQAFAESQTQLEDTLKEVPKETHHSIRSLSKSVAEDHTPENPEGNPNLPQDGAFMETSSSIKWIYIGNSGKSEILKNKNVDDVSLPPSAQPSSRDDSEGEDYSGGGGSGGGGRRCNGSWVGNSDEPPLPPFPNGNHPHDCSSSSNHSNNPRRRRGIGGISPLAPEGSTTYSGSISGHSQDGRYEKEQRQVENPTVFNVVNLDDTNRYQYWLHSVEHYLKWHRTDFEDDIDHIILFGAVMDGKSATWYDARAESMKK